MPKAESDQRDGPLMINEMLGSTNPITNIAYYIDMMTNPNGINLEFESMASTICE